jgi:hypothetical protein
LIAPRTVHPGDEVELTVVLAGDSGAETSQRVRYRVPVGAPAGPLSFTVSDATSTNLLEFQSVAGTPQRSAQQVLNLLTAFRSNTKAYLRVWRSEPSFTVEGRDLPAPPPSLAMILSRGQQGTGNLLTARGATLAEIEIPAGARVVVTGSKTAQVDVKE